MGMQLTTRYLILFTLIQSCHQISLSHNCIIEVGIDTVKMIMQYTHNSLITL